MGHPRRLSPRVLTSSGAIALVSAAGALVLAALSLAGIIPIDLTCVAAICLGAGLLARGARVAHDLHGLPADAAATDDQADVGEAAANEVLGGAAAIVLAVLALIGFAPLLMLGVAAIATGGTLLAAADAHYKRTARDSARVAVMFVRAGIWAVAGTAAVSLGVIALTGVHHALVLIESATIVSAFAFVAAVFLRADDSLAKAPSGHRAFDARVSEPARARDVERRSAAHHSTAHSGLGKYEEAPDADAHIHPQHDKASLHLHGLVKQKMEVHEDPSAESWNALENAQSHEQLHSDEPASPPEAFEHAKAASDEQAAKHEVEPTSPEVETSLVLAESNALVPSEAHALVAVEHGPHELARAADVSVEAVMNHHSDAAPADDRVAPDVAADTRLIANPSPLEIGRDDEIAAPSVVVQELHLVNEVEAQRPPVDAVAVETAPQPPSPPARRQSGWRLAAGIALRALDGLVGRRPVKRDVSEGPAAPPKVDAVGPLFGDVLAPGELIATPVSEHEIETSPAQARERVVIESPDEGEHDRDDREPPSLEKLDAVHLVEGPTVAPTDVEPVEPLFGDVLPKDQLTDVPVPAPDAEIARAPVSARGEDTRKTHKAVSDEKPRTRAGARARRAPKRRAKDTQAGQARGQRHARSGRSSRKG